MVAGAAAGLVALGWCVLAIRLGPRAGYLDVPGGDELKAHSAPAVPLGGVGIFLGVHAGMVLGGNLDPGLLAASGLALGLGLVDDHRGLSPQLRLGVESLAGVVLAGWALVPAGWNRPLTIVATAFLVVVCVNAVNLFDGLDGLAGSAALVTGLGITWLGTARGLEVAVGAILAAALAGFLVLNWHRARVFLGDNGAYVVGVFLVYGMLQASPRTGVDLLVATGVLGVFVLDLVVTVVRRLRGHRPLFSRDRHHLYDQVRQRGFSVPEVAFLTAGLQAVLVAIVVSADHLVDDLTAFLLLALLGLALLFALSRRGFLRAT